MFCKNFCFIFIFILTNIQFSHQTDCISTTYSQNLDIIQLSISQITIDDFANTTQIQIINRLKEIFNETVIQINYSITKTDRLINVAYNIIYACNETITIPSINGIINTITMNPNFNKTKIDNMISCGLIDRTNYVALKAQQMNSSLNDISCEFHFGHENFFEWTIEGLSSIINGTLLKNFFKNYKAFQNALRKHFSTKLSKSYGTRIANVSFISRNMLANDRIGFTFRVYFFKAISDRHLRTEILSNIQSTYYDVIRIYFAAKNKSVNLPISVKINLPAAVNIISKKTNLINRTDVVQSTISYSTVSLIKKISVRAARMELDRNTSDESIEQGSIKNAKTKTNNRTSAIKGVKTINNTKGSKNLASTSRNVSKVSAKNGTFNRSTALRHANVVTNSKKFNLVDAPILNLMITETSVTPTPMTRPTTTRSTITTITETTTATTTTTVAFTSTDTDIVSGTTETTIMPISTETNLETTATLVSTESLTIPTSTQTTTETTFMTLLTESTILATTTTSVTSPPTTEITTTPDEELFSTIITTDPTITHSRETTVRTRTTRKPKPTSNTKITRTRKTRMPKSTRAPGSHFTKIIIPRPPYLLKNFNFQKYYTALLVYILRKRFIEFSLSSSSKVPFSDCRSKDHYVTYMYKYDIHGPLFNSSFQDVNSPLVQHLQSMISDRIIEQLYKQNLLSHIRDRIQIRKILDVSEEYQNIPTIRLYISINLQKSFIPAIHHIFQYIFEKLQKENLSLFKNNIL